MSMNKVAVQNKKVIEKYKKKVKSKYPGAFASKLSNGKFTIQQEQDDLTVKDILAEMFLLPVDTEIKAWELAQYSVKIAQNLDRTHPLRIEGMNLEDKLARVEARKHRAETKRESRKNDDSYIY